MKDVLKYLIAAFIGALVSYSVTHVTTPSGKSRKETVARDSNKLGKYVYLDMSGTLHTKQKCKAVCKTYNSQGVEPYIPEELSSYNSKKFCSQCVSEEQITAIKELVKQK